MTDERIAALGPAFAAELRRYRDCFGQDRKARHFDTYCRGLLSDLPRKSVEPIARASGTAVRTLQEFLVTSTWDHVAARDRLQRRMADALAERPDDPLGVVGVIDETSCVKKGDRTPGVRRQDLGCVGKIDNGIVTVHVGVAKGRFQALLDAEPYLPASWAADRERCASGPFGSRGRRPPSGSTPAPCGSSCPPRRRAKASTCSGTATPSFTSICRGTRCGCTSGSGG
jgi:SRSO17 transposase